MKITMTPTAIMTELDGLPVRLWEGTTARGVPVRVFVARLSTPAGVDAKEMADELFETLPPAEYVPLLTIYREEAGLPLPCRPHPPEDLPPLDFFEITRK